MRISLMAILPLFAALVLVACGEKTPDPSSYLNGEVIWITGNLTNLEANSESNGLVSYSNETVRFGDPSLVFRVHTINGIYTIQIDPTDRGGSEGPQTVHSLAAALTVGTKIRFPTELHGRHNPRNDPIGFSKSKIGMLDPDDIELLAN